MASKKVILFIVEGVTEETSFGEVVKLLYKNKNIFFQVVRGDIFSNKYTNTDNVIEKVNQQIVISQRETHYKDSDIIQIVHLVDLDGTFIDKTKILYGDTEHIQYTNESIITNNVEYIIKRNEKKALLLNKLCNKDKIKKIPYRIYYFSSNLEHVLHNVQNASRKQKDELADKFSDEYYNKPIEFLNFINSKEIVLSDDYNESWEKIKIDNNSLNRYSNFNLFFKDMNNLID